MTTQKQRQARQQQREAQYQKLNEQYMKQMDNERVFKLKSITLAVRQAIEGMNNAAGR
jgi:hypothetical protein